jgi:hypothetical protein
VFGTTMGKKSKAKGWPRLQALLDNNAVQAALAELAAAAITALAAAIANSTEVRRKAAKLKQKGEEKLDELTEA